MDEGTLSFVVENQFLGVAHRGLKGKKVVELFKTWAAKMTAGFETIKQ